MSHGQFSIGVNNHIAESDTSARCLAWFIAPSLQEHATRLADWISGDDYTEIDRVTWDAIEELSDSSEWVKQVVHLANKYYVASGSYDVADRRFAEAIRPLLSRYAIDDCIALILGIQDNGQTWERGRARVDHRDLRTRAIELDPTFDASKYAVFNRPLD